MESILNSTKKLLNIAEENTDFDTEITIHINSVLMILTQLGVGPEEGYKIEDENDLWSDFLPEGIMLASVKTFVGLKVRLIFDPPSNSSHLESINRLIAECEWRIKLAIENTKEN